jgi:bifunctional polynucleotide phosphatase/kinase
MKQTSNNLSSDGINSDPTARKGYALLAQNLGVPAQVLHFTTPADLCLHNDSVRALGGPLVSSSSIINPSTLLSQSFLLMTA